MAPSWQEMILMAREGSDVLEMAALIARDYLPGPWRKATVNNIDIKKVTGGLSNWLYQMSLAAPVSVNDQTIPRSVLLRFHGQVNGESAFEHVVTESVVFTLLSERKLGPKLYGIFPGGRVEEFINARALTVSEMAEPEVSLVIAEKMAEVHKLVVPMCKRPTWLYELSQKYINSITNIQKQIQPQDSTTRNTIQLLAQYNLNDELDWLREYLESIKSPVVFCHNDMNEGNILRRLDSAKKNDLVLIDYEYCAYNYRAFDLANHFLEYTLEYTSEPPYFRINPDAYPSAAHQMQFALRYLTKFRSTEESPLELSELDKEAHRLVTEVDNFKLACHFFWALWSGANAFNKIPFGYWEFFAARFESYLSLKEEIISFEVPGNKRKKT